MHILKLGRVKMRVKMIIPHNVKPYSTNLAPLHDCQMISTCCGAGANEFADNFCNGCNEFAEFECVEWLCPAGMPEIPEHERK